MLFASLHPPTEPSSDALQTRPRNDCRLLLKALHWPVSQRGPANPVGIFPSTATLPLTPAGCFPLEFPVGLYCGCSRPALRFSHAFTTRTPLSLYHYLATCRSLHCCFWEENA
ncbi:hypothetical protein M3J09_008786 [Ascochyta lentis]